MKILIVEDENLLADSIRALLTKKGFEVDVAYDGESGEEYAQLGIYEYQYDAKHCQSSLPIGNSKCAW